MKRGLGVYASVGVLILIVLFAAYFLNLKPTGFAIFEQQSESDFDEGIYSNVIYNGSAIVLNESVNVTSGTYTSKTFDAGSSAQWNNLSWTGQGELEFEVRACLYSNCSTQGFDSVDLNNLNLSGQYFQYKVDFSQGENQSSFLQGVSIGYSVEEQEPEVSVSVDASQPSGQKSSQLGIPLQFTATGEGITCQYNILDASDNAVITPNTTIEACTNSTTFDLGANEGAYIFNIYVSNGEETAHDSLTFSISISTNEEEEETEEEESAETTEESQSPSTETTAITSTTEISANDIQGIVLNPGSSQEITWNARNSGTTPLSACLITPTGDYASWISFSEDTSNLNPGDERQFTFTIFVPEDAEENSYIIGVSAGCFETSVSKEFTISVEKKKLEFDVINAERIRGDEVRIVYSLKELSGQDQTIVLAFSILDSDNNAVSSSEETQSLGSNSSDEFSAFIPINESLEGNYTLSTNINSEIYSESVQEPIFLGAPVGGFAGFAVFEGLGAGGTLILIIVAVSLIVILFVARRMRKSNKTLMDLFGGTKKQSGKTKNKTNRINQDKKPFNSNQQEDKGFT